MTGRLGGQALLIRLMVAYRGGRDWPVVAVWLKLVASTEFAARRLVWGMLQAKKNRSESGFFVLGQLNA